MKESSVKNKSVLSGGLLVAAAIMLFNPNISVFDILPDFIACICIIAATSRLAGVISYFDDARSAFIKLAIVSASRMPIWVMIVSVTADHTEQRSLYTVFTLAYLVVELIYAVPAFKSLFAGFSYLAERYGCKEAIGTPSISCDGLRSLTVALFFVKDLMAFLPDLCYLYQHDHVGSVSRYNINWLELRPIFVVVAAIIALVFAVIWLVYYIPYVRRLSASPALCDVVTASESEARPLDGKRRFRLIYAALTLVVIGTVFNVDFPIDNMDVAPDFISALCYLAAFAVICKQYELKWPSFAISVFYFFTSIATFAVSQSFFSEYEYEAIGKSVTAFEKYMSVIVVVAFDSLVLIGVSIMITTMLYHIAMSHTDFTKREKSRAKAMCIGFGAIGAINAIASFLYTFLLSITKEVEANDKLVSGGVVVFPLFEYLWIIVMVIGIVWMIYTLALVARLKSGAEEKYLFM